MHAELVSLDNRLPCPPPRQLWLINRQTSERNHFEAGFADDIQSMRRIRSAKPSRLRAGLGLPNQLIHMAVEAAHLIAFHESSRLSQLHPVALPGGILV